MALCAFPFIAQPAFADADDHAPPEKVVTEVPVRVGKITRATLRSYITTFGNIEPQPAGKNESPASARVASPVAGVVGEIKCYDGEHVKKGDLLFELDSRTANVAVETADKIFERQKKLLSVGGTSQKALQDAEQQLAAARAQKALLEIHAPLSGTVVRVNTKPGEAVDATTVLAEIIDFSRLVVSANIPSADIAQLKIGAPVKISSDTHATNGHVIFIGSSIDPKTGSVLVRISLPQNSGFLPGQFVSVQIVSAEYKNVLVAPIESVTKNEEGKSMISVVEGDKAIQKMISTGLREKNLVEVTGDDLREGTEIVTTGAYALPAETKIRVIGD